MKLEEKIKLLRQALIELLENCDNGNTSNEDWEAMKLRAQNVLDKTAVEPK